MGKSVLVFVSHSSEDKISLIEPIVSDLENCYINVWFDKRNILPGDNLRKSIFRDGLDKADIALIFFTEKSLNSSWVDKEIKHVLREESKKGNNFDLKKIISIFDSQETYTKISERYPELTDDLLHLMPTNYSKIHLGQLVSAIWSKYLSLQGGSIEIQRQLLSKDQELFQKDKDIQDLNIKLRNLKSNTNVSLYDEFENIYDSKVLSKFIDDKKLIIESGIINKSNVENLTDALIFGILEHSPKNVAFVRLTTKGSEFFKWLTLFKNGE